MIEDTINNLINSKTHFPSEGDNLLGMDYDVFHAFDSREIFSEIDVKQTDKEESMFEIQLSISEEAKELHHVRTGLIDAWAFIQYGYFEASSMNIGRKQAVLRFVTLIGENQFYVTGTVTVSGAKYQQLARNA